MLSKTVFITIKLYCMCVTMIHSTRCIRYDFVITVSSSILICQQVCNNMTTCCSQNGDQSINESMKVTRHVVGFRYEVTYVSFIALSRSSRCHVLCVVLYLYIGGGGGGGPC